jgi:hypothetical protein
LEALTANSYNTRRTAARELARLWPAAAGFPIDGPPERRAATLEQLGRRFREEFGSEGIAAAVSTCPEKSCGAGLPPAQATGTAAPQTTTDAATRDQTVARVDQCLGRLGDAGSTPADRKAASESLLAVGPTLVPVLEELTAGRQLPLPEAVYHEVLPRQNPVYAALDRLASGSLAQKRRAADKPLGRLAAERLAAVAVKQGDPLVWQGVLAAVDGDVSPGAVQLAYAAIGHPAAEVRRRACQYLASHPDPRHVAVLLPALGDSNDQVVTAALRAIGAAGKIDDPQPVRRLLTASDEMQRLEAAGALARLGDPSGLAALERLSYSDNPSARQRTAELMGELGSEACLALLIRLLDDNWQSVRLAALKSLPKVAGRDVARTEGEWSVTAAQRTTLWKQWYQQRAE